MVVDARGRREYEFEPSQYSVGGAFDAYTPDWQLPRPWPLVKAHLTLVANPNSPTGTTVPTADLERLAESVRHLLWGDDLPADFAAEDIDSLDRRGVKQSGNRRGVICSRR